MMIDKPFDIVYAPQVKSHLKWIERKYHVLIRQVIEEQLLFQANVETRNRKPLSRPVEFGADWELRFGPGNRFRVFYEIDTENWVVYILAIGTKRGNQLKLGGEVIDL